MSLSAGEENNRSCAEAVPPSHRSFAVDGEASDLPCITSLLDFKLRRAQLLVYHDFAETLAKLKLRPAEFSVLAMIAKYPGQKQTTIAENLGIKRANFVFLMDSIEARGFAERRKGHTDRRSHSLHLTDEGAAFVKRMSALWHEHEGRMVERLGGRDNLEQLIVLLDRLLGQDAARCKISLDPH